MTRPNILYIHSHDTGRYVQPYGHAVPTPHLQRLAEQGVLFRQAFCAGPTCSPSRAALLTGQYPHTNGMVGLAHRGSRLNDYSRHLAGVLGRAGYATALAGVQHEVRAEERQLLGYGEYLTESTWPAGRERDEWTADRACAFLARPHDQPFLLTCGFFQTHRQGRGIQVFNDRGVQDGDPRYVRPPATLPDTPEIRQDVADFAAAAGRLDALMGRVFAALERHGLADQTLVLCTTDHGIPFPFMKCNLTDHGTGVMLILRGPGACSGGRVVDALVSQVDLFPTLCDIAGVPHPDGLQGHSLLPLLEGRVASVRDAVFAEVNYHAAPEPMRTVRTARHRYIRRFAPLPHPVLSNIDDGASKQALLRAGWRERASAAESLFDLVFDPNEACNRAGDPAYQSALDDMRGRLDRWMRETDDPLLRGRIDPWPGMISNPANGNSPQEPSGPTAPIVCSDKEAK